MIYALKHADVVCMQRNISCCEIENTVGRTCPINSVDKDTAASSDREDENQAIVSLGKSDQFQAISISKIFVYVLVENWDINAL